MKKLTRERLLLSTCLTGAALAMAPGVQAQSSDPTWQPRIDVEAQAGERGSQVSLEMFAPLAQDETNLFFLTGRVGHNEQYERNGSLTVGGRGQLAEDFALGVNVGADFHRSELSSRSQAAVSFGLEGFTSIFDVRLNYRLTTTNRHTLAFQNPEAASSGVLLIDQNRLIERRSGFRLEEVPLSGANGEVGARLPLSDRLSARISAGGFDYRDSSAEQSYRGLRGGLELDIEDPVGAGSRFSLGGKLEDDNRFGTHARVTARLTIPLGPRPTRERRSSSSGLDRQMGERVRRDYVAASGTRYRDLASTDLAIDARTGRAFGGIYFTSGGAAAGAGTNVSPTTLQDAVTRAGENGVVVALGDAGPISTGGVVLAENQYLVGGASAVAVRRADGSITHFGFGGTNGTITGSNPVGAAISLGQGSVIRDLTISSSGAGVAANGVGGFVLDRIVVENTGGAGLSLTNTIGAVMIDGLTVRGAGGAGVLINGGSSIAVRNSTIAGGASAIDINDGSANLTAALSNLSLSASGGAVLDIDGSGSGTVTVSALSGISIAGGNGEEGGFAARNVTFDGSVTAGVQPVDAGTMQVGTTAARVSGVGVSLTEVSGALSFTDLDVANSGGTGLIIRNSKAGDFTLSSLDGSADTDLGTALDLDPLHIDLILASVSSTDAAGAGVVLDNVHGVGAGGNALTIGTLNVSNAGLQGLLITGESTGLVTVGGGAITGSGGAAVQLGESGIAGSGGTIGLNFGGSIAGTAAAPLVALFNSGGDVRFSGAIGGSGQIVVDGTRSGTSVQFAGAITLTGVASPAVSLDNVAGSFVLSGPLAIANPAGDGIRIGAVPGSVAFGDVAITGLGSGAGVDLTGAQGNISFASLDISGSSAPGSRGIDLTGATNAGTIVISGSSALRGVDIGVDLTNAAISGGFRFGDGNAGNGQGSSITANTPILASGLDASRGLYDFSDAQLTGDTSNLTGGSFTAYYVLAGATGSGGSAAEAGSLAGALASAAEYIVLLNNPDGGQDVIDTLDLGGAFTLSTGQKLVSFLYNDFFAVTGATVPANLIVSEIAATGITNPFAGSGAAILTSTTPLGDATVTLADNSRIDGVVIQNAAGGVGVGGSGVSNASIVNSVIAGSGGAVSITDGSANASVTLINLDLSATGGTALNLSGAGTGTLAVNASDVSVSATGAAVALAINDVASTGISLSSVSAGTSAGAAVALDGVTGAAVSIGTVSVGGTGAGVGIGIANSTAAIAIGNVSVGAAAGDGVSLSGNSGGIVLGNVRVEGSAGNGLALGANSGAIDIGAIAIANAGGTGLNIANAAGRVTIGGGTVTAGSGISVHGIAAGTTVTIGLVEVTGAAGISVADVDGILRFTSGTSIIAAGNAGIAFGAGSTGNIEFGDVDIVALGAGASGIDARNASGTISFATLDIMGASTNGTRGIDLSGARFAESFTVAEGGSISGVGIGVDLANAEITGSFRYGDGSNTDANAAGSTISALTPLVLAGLNGGAGSYDLSDVNLLGDTSNLAGSATLYWVRQGASGAGTRSDPGTLAGALASGAEMIVLLNDLTGGADVLDANDPLFGVGGTLTLAAGQQLVSFLNGDTAAAPGGAPVNVRLYNIAAGVITNPFAGSGAPTLTTTAGGAPTLVVTGNNLIDGVVITNAGGGAGVFGSGAMGVTIRNSSISASGSAIALDAGAGAGSVALSNLLLRSSGPTTPLLINAAAADPMTITQLSGIRIAGGQGEAQGVFFGGTTFDADLTAAGYQTVNGSLTIGSASNRVDGRGAVFIDALGSLNLADLSIYSDGDYGLHVQGGGIDLTSQAGTIDTTGSNAALLSGARIGLVLDRIVQSGPGVGVAVDNSVGIGAGGRAMDVAALTASGGVSGISITGANSGSFVFGSGSSITGTSGSAVLLGGGSADLRYDGSISQTSGAILTVAGHVGSVTFGNGSALTAVGGTGLLFVEAAGSYVFAGSTSLLGGARIAIANNSAGSFTFGSGTSVTDGMGGSLWIQDSTASLTYSGTVTETATGMGAVGMLNHRGGTIDLTGATLSIAGGLGIGLFNADGTYRFGDMALSGGAGIAILSDSAGSFTFGNVDVTGVAASTTAIDLTGAAGDVTFATLDISGASASGSRGIDLTGNAGSGNIVIYQGGTLSGVGVGVDLTNAARTGSFRFGDGSNEDGDGAASIISAANPLVLNGLNGGLGSYDFADVNLLGDTSNLSVSAYFVQAGATGVGTASDPGSLSGAMTSGATYIVLLNDPDGGGDVIDATSAGGSLVLAGGQYLYGFRDTDAFNVGGGAPANVVLYNVQSGVISNPFAGSGAPTLTTSGGAHTVVLGGSNVLNGLVIANAGSGAGIWGSGTGGRSVVHNSTVSGGAAGAINIADGGSTATVALRNLTLAASGGNILRLDGSGSGVLMVTDFFGLTALHTSEASGFAVRDVVFDADPIAAGAQSVAGGNLTLGASSGRIAGIGFSLDDVEGNLGFADVNIANDGGTGLVVTNAKTNNFLIGSTGGDIDTINGTAVDLDPLAIDLMFDTITASGGVYGVLLDQVEGRFTVRGAVNITNAGSAGLAIRNNNGQTDPLTARFLGAVTINSTSGAGVLLTDNAGANASFGGGLDITTAGGAGFAASGGGTLAVTGTSNNIATAGGTALDLDGVTIGAGGLTFSTIDVNAAPFGVRLASVASSDGGEIDLGTVSLQGVTASGVGISTALGATLTIDDLDIGIGGVGATGFNLRNAVLGADIAIGDFDMTNAAVPGTGIGIDLRGATGGRSVRLGESVPGGASASISGVGTGVYLDAGSSIDFTFGDGEAATDGSSMISAPVAIDASAAPASGTYNFRDVTFVSSPGLGFGIGRTLFVDSDGAAGGGNGSGADGANPMTLAAAEAAQTAGDVFLLVNNGASISAAGTNGDDSFKLLDGASVHGFGGPGGAVTLNFTIPSTIQLAVNSLTISNPGSGAATLTSSANADVITLGSNGNTLSGFILDGSSGALTGVKSAVSGSANAVIQHVTARDFLTAAVYLATASDTQIGQVTFADNARDLYLGAANNVTITDLTSTGANASLQIGAGTGTIALSNMNIGGAEIGISLSSATGTISATNVDIAGATVAGLDTSGGSASINFDATSSILQNSGGAAVQVRGGDTGVLGFGGTINATSGTGLQFDVANGTYNFTGTTTLNGGDAGIDILGGSSGTFGFGTGTSITNPSGTAFHLSASNANVTYSGSIVDADGYAVHIDDHDAGTILFDTGTIASSGTSALGINVLNNGGGAVIFAGQTTLDTSGNDALVLAANLGSTVAFSGGLDITTTSGSGVRIQGGGAVNILGAANSLTTTSGTPLDIYNATSALVLDFDFSSIANSLGANGIRIEAAGGTITGSLEVVGGAITASNRGVLLRGDALAFGYGGTIAASGSARSVEATSRTGGTATLSGNITDTGAGISATNNSGGTIAFTGSSIALSTGTNTAVTLANNAGATISFSPLAGGNGLDIATTSGIGFGATGGGTVIIAGSGNSIQTDAGRIIDIDGIVAGAGGINFDTLSSSSVVAGAAAIRLNNLDGSNFSVTGSTNIGGTAAGLDGLFIGGGSAASFNFASFAAANIGEDGIHIDGAGNGAITFGSAMVQNVGSAGNGVRIVNANGAVAINAGLISGGAGGSAVLVSGGTGAVSIGADLSKLSSGNIVSLNGHSGAAATFAGNISAAGGVDNGILLSGNGGAINFTGRSISLSTGAFTGISVAGALADATVRFASAAGGNGLDISTTSGTGVALSGGAAATYVIEQGGGANSIVTGSGTILSIANSTANAMALDMTLASASNGSGASGILVNRLGTGAVTGKLDITSGSITASSRGVDLNGDSLDFAYGGSITTTGAGARSIEVTGHSANAVRFTGAISDSGAGINIANNSGGSILLSGTINASGVAATAPLIISGNTGGTITLSGATKRFQTTGPAAVSLSNNMGATINFADGGLAIGTTTGIGLAATGGGTLSVSGANNMITTGTGTALTVSNTSIGTAGLNFRSISSNGAATGILLDNTGAQGGLTVTGTGTLGSGGTIQNSTGDGISLTNTENVRLTYMNILNNLGDGIGGTNVNGFLLDHMSITGNGNDAASDESGINIAGLTGTASNGARPTGIFNSTISNNFEFEVQITNSAGTLTNFQINNTQLSSNGASGQHGNLLNFLGSGTSAMGLTVLGSSFTGNWNAATPPLAVTGTGLHADTSGSSMTLDVSGSTFTNNNAGVSVSTGPGSSTLTYRISGNMFVGQRASAINDFHNGNAPFSRAVYGTIQNNIIGSAGVASSGSWLGNGISISNEGAVNATYLISNNIIRQLRSFEAIAVNVGLGGTPTGGGTTNLTILNNTISDIAGSRAITIQDNQTIAAPFPTIRLNMSGNSFTNIAGQAGNGQFLRLRVLDGAIQLSQMLATAGAGANELDDLNGFNDPTKISTSVGGAGTITYGQSVPPQPPTFSPLP